MIGEFTQNALVTIITQTSSFLFGLGTSIIIARILGPEGKGIYSLAILLPSFLVYFSHLGIGHATVFYLGKRKYPSTEVLGNNISCTILLSAGAISVGLLIILFFSNNLFSGVASRYLFLALLVVPLHLFLNFTVYILLGLQKITKYNFILFIRVFLFFAFVVILLLGFHLGVGAAIIAEVLAFFIACIVSFLVTKRETGGICLKPKSGYLKSAFSYGIKTHLGSILSFLHYRIDMLLINAFSNPLMVGFYSLSAGFAEKIWLVSDAAGTVLFPRISSETDERNLKEFTPLVFRSVLLITAVIGILLLAMGHWLIVLFYSEAFVDSIKPFKILLIGTIAISGWRILENDLKGRGRPMANTYITGISLVINVILNVLWIPKFGILGAAWATSVSYNVVLLITVVFYGKISRNRIKDVISVKKSDLEFYLGLLVVFRDSSRVKEYGVGGNGQS